jgi:AraC-like DNA-binding protein
MNLKIPVRVGLLRVTFSTDRAPRIVDEQCSSELHDHHDFELRYIASGQSRQMISGVEYTANASEMILVHPREYHLQATPRHHTEQYTIRFYPEPHDNSRASMRAFELAIGFLNNARILKDVDGRLLTAFCQLADELKEQRAGYVSNVSALCSTLMTHLFRLAPNDMSKIYPAESLQYHDFERHAIDAYVHANALSDSIRIGDLAVKMAISERQVNNIMHKRFGMSFVAKINDIRVHHAAVLLSETDRSIEHILGECGFKNHSYFCACFKRHFGTTPLKYRAEHRKSANNTRGQL